MKRWAGRVGSSRCGVPHRRVAPVVGELQVFGVRLCDVDDSDRAAASELGRLQRPAQADRFQALTPAAARQWLSRWRAIAMTRQGGCGLLGIRGFATAKTQYDYDANGLLIGLTPPGESAWTMSYTQIGGETERGRLSQVSRAVPAGTATSTVAYNVALTGANAPMDMSLVVDR